MPFAISSASTARVRSPGDSEAVGRLTSPAPRPNLASSVRASDTVIAVARMKRVEQRPLVARAERGPARARRPRRSGRGTPRPRRRRCGRGSAAAASSCRCRCGRRSRPARRRRSSASIGPSTKSPRRTTTSVSRATIAPLRAASPNVSRSCHGSRGSSTTSSRSIARSVRAALPASCSVWLILNARMFLSFSDGSFFALLRPCVAHSRSRWARPAGRLLLGVLLVALAGVLGGELALGEVRVPAAGVQRRARA